MSEILRLIPGDGNIGERIDVFVSKAADMSRSSVVKLIESQAITICGRSVKKNAKIITADEVCVCLPDAQTIDVKPENIPLDIVYEDAYLLVVNKPKGMVVHPAPGNYDGTLVNALMYHCQDSLSSINGMIRPGIVHRIDKDTSGLLIVAKCDEAHIKLSNQIKEHSFERRYNAILYGNIREDEFSVDAPIGRHPKDRKKMAVINPTASKSAREAVSHFKVLERFNSYTYVEVRLETGRTHQIRVHSASIGHPVIGDTVYKPNQDKFEKANESLLSGQCLHARIIGFTHPVSGEYLYFDSNLPPYFEEILKKLRQLQ